MVTESEKQFTSGGSAQVERRAADFQQVGQVLSGLTFVDQLAGVVGLLGRKSQSRAGSPALAPDRDWLRAAASS